MENIIEELKIELENINGCIWINKLKEKFAMLNELQIRYYIIELGYGDRMKERKQQGLNKYYFNKIESPDKAYWLGFILADGYLDNRGRFGIELEQKDIGHLEKFKEAIGYKRDIKIYHKKSTFGEQDNCRISFMNAQFTHDLIKLGITLDKSNTGVFPKISKELYPHMIRGYLDGNGTIRIQENKKEEGFRLTGLSFCGTKEILQDIETFSDFKWSWSKRKDNNTNNYQIATGKRIESETFLKQIYYNKDNVCLDRKLKKVEKLKWKE